MGGKLGRIRCLTSFQHDTTGAHVCIHTTSWAFRLADRETERLWSFQRRHDNKFFNTQCDDLTTDTLADCETVESRGFMTGYLT